MSSQFLNLLWTRGLSRLGGLGFGVIIVGCGEVLIVTEKTMQPWKSACGLLNCCLTPAFAKYFSAPGSLLVVWVEVIRVPGSKWVQLQLFIIRQTSWYRVQLSSLLGLQCGPFTGSYERALQAVYSSDYIVGIDTENWIRSRKDGYR